MTKKELALEVIRRLKAEYPDSECSLDYDDAWKLLVTPNTFLNLKFFITEQF